jgi:hypothetical protein
MRYTRWWQFGLLGGLVLSLATIIKLIRTFLIGAVIGGAVGQAGWTDAVGFALAIFGMGFVCGAGILSTAGLVW